MYNTIRFEILYNMIATGVTYNAVQQLSGYLIFSVFTKCRPIWFGRHQLFYRARSL